MGGMYAPYCAGVFLREAEGVGLPVVERLFNLATFLQTTCEKVTRSQSDVTIVSLLLTLAHSVG